MKTSVPVAGSSSGRYNLRRSLKKKWACACCIGKDNFEKCKKRIKLEKSKKKLQQPALIQKTAPLTDAAKLYVKLSMEKTGIQIPVSYARLIKEEHNLRICTVSLYQTPMYPRVDDSKEEEVEEEISEFYAQLIKPEFADFYLNKNSDEHFLLFKEELIYQSITLYELNLFIPIPVMQVYLTDGELKLGILKPCGENNVYDLICTFFEEKRHLLLFKNNIKVMLLLTFESIFSQKLLFKNQIEEMEYEQHYEEFFKNKYSSLQLSLRFLIRFILNLPKWNILNCFHSDTKRDIMICINGLLRYIEEKNLQDPTIENYKNTIAME